MEVGLTARIKPSIDKRSLSREVDSMRGAVEEQFEELDLGITQLLDDDGAGLMGSMGGGDMFEGDMLSSAMGDIRSMGQESFVSDVLGTVADLSSQAPTPEERTGSAAPAAPAGGGDDDMLSELFNDLVGDITEGLDFDSLTEKFDMLSDNFSDELDILGTVIDEDSALLGGIAGRLGGVTKAVGALGGILTGGLAAVAVTGFVVRQLQGIWEGIRSLSSTSPLLGQVVSILEMATMLLFRPFANLIGRILLPMVSSILATVIEFNQISFEESITEGVKFLARRIFNAIFSIPGLIVTGFLAVGTVLGGYIGSAVGAYVASALAAAINAKLGVAIGGTLGSVIPGFGTAVGAVVGGLIFAGIGLLIAFFRDDIMGFLVSIKDGLMGLVNGFVQFISNSELLFSVVAPLLLPFLLLYIELQSILQNTMEALDNFLNEARSEGILSALGFDDVDIDPSDIFPEIGIGDIIGSPMSIAATDLVDSKVSILAKNVIMDKVQPVVSDLISRIQSWNVNDVLPAIGWNLHNVLPPISSWSITDLISPITDWSPSDLFGGGNGSDGGQSSGTPSNPSADPPDSGTGGGGGGGGGGGVGGGGPPSAPGRMARMAEGGIVTSATNAVIGEGRESEAVMPLSKLQSVIDASGGTNVSVEGGSDMDSTALEDEIEASFEDASDDIVRELTRLRRLIRNQEQDIVVKVGEREIIEAVHTAEQNTRNTTRVDR